MLDIRIWEVGAGLAVRIRTPSGQNHIIDAGRTSDFSPAEHIRNYHWHEGDGLDYLIISHQDSDHVEDLPQVLRLLGDPRVLLKNSTVPAEEKYGSRERDYQKALIDLDNRYTRNIDWDISPANPNVNGGITIKSFMNRWERCNDNINNSSIVVSYTYQDVAVIFPGDIEPDGWNNLVSDNNNLLDKALDAETRILLAPHHGRPSGYSGDMIDYIQPHLIVISDGYGAGDTDLRFRANGIGLEIKGIETKYVTTKNKGRKRITISDLDLLEVYEADE